MPFQKEEKEKTEVKDSIVVTLKRSSSGRQIAERDFRQLKINALKYVLQMLDPISFEKHKDN